MMSRRKFLLLLAGAGLGGPAYARYVEPRWLALRRHAVRLKGVALKRPVRILHLADFHVSPHVPHSFIEEAVAMGLAEQPDLICLTGDFITRHIDEPERYRRILAPLAERAPTYACLGNHDGGQWIAARGGYPTIEPLLAFLAGAGITTLVNEARSLSIGGQPIQLIGAGDLWTEYFQPERMPALPPRAAHAPTLLLAHNPDSKDALAHVPWDLMLSGHTHGGQVSLPILGTPFAPVQDQRYVEGLHTWRDRMLHVTRGVGNLHGVRFNCRPEVSVLDLA